MNTRQARHALMALAAALVLTSACGHEEAEQAPAQLEPIQASVIAAEAVSESKPIEVYGVIHPTRQAFVSSRVTGPVTAIHVQAGDSVRSGQKILDIQPEAIEGQVSQAQGALAQAQAAHALAERNFQRYQALHDEHAASDLELDMARMQLEQAEGAVRQAEGALQAASSVAAEAVVKAPFAGRIVDTLVEVGDLATPGRPLVQVEALSGRQLWIEVRAADIERVAIGDTLAVRLDSRPDLGQLQGAVAESVPSADAATHTFTVKVSLADVDVPSGLSGRAMLPGDAIDRIVIPASAVHRRGGLELVVVRSDDGTARTRAVTTGATSADGRTEILSGVNPGEVILVDAPGPLADGTPVEVR
jgi:RND family efflux transporter MFP subunit